MKFHKTGKEARTSYSYEFKNEDGDAQKVTILPGQNGVTELDIAFLHKLDDREVENNLKTLKAPRTEKEKEEIAAWSEEYSRVFEDRYGYAPCEADLKAAVAARFPMNWHLSLDEVDDEFKDKSTIRFDESQEREEEFRETIHARIETLLEGLTQREKDIYELVVLKEMKKKEAAAVLSISDSYVSRVMKKIEGILRNDKVLQKIYSASSDSV